MKEIKAEGNTDYNVGYVETWYNETGYGNWEGVMVNRPQDLDHLDFVGKIQGVDLSNRGFCGVAAEEKMFELSSYLFDGAIITVGKKRASKENFN